MVEKFRRQRNHKGNRMMMAHKDIIKYITPEEKKISIEGKKFTKKKPVTNI